MVAPAGTDITISMTFTVNGNAQPGDYPITFNASSLLYSDLEGSPDKTINTTLTPGQITVAETPAAYTVTTNSGITGGSIAVDPASGSAGTVVKVAVTPDNGKQLVAGSLKYTADDGSTYTFIGATEGLYSFILPAANVVVSAQFENTGAGSLSITSVLPGYTSGTVAITLGGQAETGHSFVYDSSFSAVNGLTTDDTIEDGTSFTNGVGIPAATGQYITIYEINSTNHVVNYVSRQITANDLGVTVGDYVVGISSSTAHTATIVRYNGAGGAVAIPSTVNINGTAYTVTATVNGTDNSPGAFCDAKATLTSVTIPDSLTDIGAYTFSGCTNLASVTLGHGLTTIGNNAFEQCNNSGFTSITIPNSVTSIGSCAFIYCSAFKEVTVGSGVTRVEDHAFANCPSIGAVYFRSSKPPILSATTFANTAPDLALYYEAANAGSVGDPASWTYFANNMTAYSVNGFCLLTLDLNYSGSITISGNAAVSGSGLLAYPATVPTRAGYVFSGWYKDAACMDAWNFGTNTVSGDLTLYAGWISGTTPGNLSITSVLGTSTIGGTTIITLGSSAGMENSFVYKVGNTPVSGLTTSSTVTDGTAFSSGSTVIAVMPGQYVTVYEITASGDVVNYICRQIAANEVKAGVNIGDFNYILKSTPSGNTAAVKSYTGSGGAVVIPGTIDYNGILSPTQRPILSCIIIIIMPAILLILAVGPILLAVHPPIP